MWLSIEDTLDQIREAFPTRSLMHPIIRERVWTDTRRAVLLRYENGDSMAAPSYPFTPIWVETWFCWEVDSDGKVRRVWKDNQFGHRVKAPAAEWFNTRSEVDRWMEA